MSKYLDAKEQERLNEARAELIALITDETEIIVRALRFDCLKLAVANAGPGIEKKEPWKLANNYLAYTLYGKPMDVA